jgi:hypothetical protein
MFRRLIPLAFALALSACTTFTDRELATFRAQRVTPPVYSKLSRGLPLNPSDVIELTRRGVSDSLIIRQIQDHGVASLIERNDVTRMRQNGVRAAVIDAMLWASDDFARRYVATDYDGAYGSFYPRWGYYRPWPWYGGVGFGVSTGRYYGTRCWR